jgi:hypothetical protein
MCQSGGEIAARSGAEQLIDYWRARFAGGQAPTRADINPADFPKLLPYIFILRRHAAGKYTFRLAGGGLRELHNRDLRGASFIDLWNENSRLPLQTAIARSQRHQEPLHLRALAHAGERRMHLEIALMPLSDGASGMERILGLYQPTTAVARLGGRPIDELLLSGLIQDENGLDHPPLRLAALRGQRVG